jgi:hypothetical protein
MFAGPAAGRVNSTATSTPAAGNASKVSAIVMPSTTCPACDGSTAAASSRAGSAVTARATSRPMRPAAPTTPTRITP